MGVMNKLRDNAGAILILLVFSFGVIWALNDVGLFDNMGTRKLSQAIVVNGEAIGAQEYSDRISQEMQLLSQQNPDGGPELEDAARERAYEGLVADRLVTAEMDRFGITVSDDEVRDLIYGQTPHPAILQYFSDGQGGLNRQALDQLRAEQPQTFLALEDYIRATRRQEKFQTLVQSLVRVSEAEVAQAFALQRDTVRAEIVGLRAAAVPDAEVKIDDAAARAYYDAHQKDYERAKTLRIVLTSIPKTASAADSANAISSLTDLKARFQSAPNDSTFLAESGSETPYNAAFQSPQQLGDAAAAVFGSGTPVAGQVFGPMISGENVVMGKVVATRAGSAPFARARHILISAPEGDAAARGAARTRLEQIKAQVQGGASFEAIARQVSQDPGSARRGGDLGWFGKGQMVGPFEDAAFGGAVGSLVGPVETQFGVHLIQVVGRTNQEARVALFTQRFRADASTLRAAEDALADYKEFSASMDSAGAAAEATRLKLAQTTQTVTDEQTTFPEIGASGALRMFLKDAEEGDVSDILNLNDRYVVARVVDVQPKGVRPFEEVKAEVTTRATLAAKLDRQAERLRAALAQGDFGGLAQRVGGQAVTASLSAARGFDVQGFGPQPALGGAVLGVPVGQTTGVVRGTDAVFVARVLAASKTPIADADKAALRAGLAAQRRQQIVQRFLQGLRDAATIEDNRAGLFQ